MTSQTDRAARFAALHIPGDPLILYNIWDVGGAKALEEIGAKAVATGSWSVAESNGYPDGHAMPLDLVMGLLERIAASVDVPLTADLVGGFGITAEEVARTAERAIAAGAVGMNFEDQVVGGTGLYDIAGQAERIGAIRRSADRSGVAFFINARTDVFLKTPPEEHSQTHLDEAVRRAEAYAGAGANGFFAPGLADAGLIGALCERSPLPVNIMMRPNVPSPRELAGLGVARISHAGAPYRAYIAAFKEAAKAAMEG